MYIDDGSDSDDLGIVADHTDLTSVDHITVDTPDGVHDIGPETVDTDGDGHPDTAIVHDADGDTVLYSDADADGRADIATELMPDGHVVIAEHDGPEHWTVVERGQLDSQGDFHADNIAGGDFTPPVDPAGDQAWSDPSSDQSGWAAPFSRTPFSAAGSAKGVVRIDSTTGQWISQN